MAQTMVSAQVIVESEELNILTAFMQPGGYQVFEAVVRHAGCAVYGDGSAGDGRFYIADSAHLLAAMGDADVYMKVLSDFDDMLISYLGAEGAQHLDGIDSFSTDISQWRRDALFFQYVYEGSDSVNGWARSIAGESCAVPYDASRQMSVKWTRWEDLRHALRLSSRRIIVEGLRKHIEWHAPGLLDALGQADADDFAEFFQGISDPTPRQFEHAYYVYRAYLLRAGFVS